LGGAPETAVVAGMPPTAAQPAGLEQARTALDAAQQALADGDWAAFGRAMQRLRDTLGPGHPPAPQAGSE
jgi:DNA-binding GntR family transcriptional regulator